jgi:hypothetical protein
MATEQSQFSKIPKKHLVFISEKLINEDFPIGNPYDYDFDKSFNTLESVSRYFGITITYEDVEFFSKFLEINEDVIADLFANNRENMENKELIEQLIIPVAKSYNLEYEIKGTCNYTEQLSQEFDCYDEDWVRDYVASENVETYAPKLSKGDAIIWKANLLHGSPDCIDNKLSRRSQVIHYHFENTDLFYNPSFSDPASGKFVQRDVKFIPND